MDWQHWEALTSPDFAALDPATTVALLPMGAVEQHGPHLPVGTDSRICDAVVDAALARPGGSGTVLRLPTLRFGVSPEHASFAGTVSLEAEVALAVLTAVGRAVASTPVRKLILFNTHGGQPQILDLAAPRLRREAGILVVRATYFRFGTPPGLVPEAEARYGLHGGMLETSLMLAIAPELVRAEHCRDFLSRAAELEQGCAVFRVEGATGIGWLAEDLNPHGVVGDAASASAELGRLLLDHHATALAALIADVQRLHWQPSPAPEASR
ncbi:MAG: creatininase family protein [Defluviicoccus sp.]